MTYDRCSGFTVFPTAAFYPIHWSEWQRYFQLDDKHKTMTTIEKSLVIHVWNKLSSSTVIKVGSDVPYARIANEYCPQIYNNCGETF